MAAHLFGQHHQKSTNPLRVVYLVMRPIDQVNMVVEAASKVGDFGERVYGAAVDKLVTGDGDGATELRDSLKDCVTLVREFCAGVISFNVLWIKLLAQHWAIAVEEQYYHLKRMKEDNDSLALDLTPFKEGEVFLKIPLWKTNYPHEDLAGIAIGILAAMSNRKRPTIDVFDGDNRISQEKFRFVKFRPYIPLPRIPRVPIGANKYNVLINNCQHFGTAVFSQLSIPRVTGIPKMLRIMDEMMELWFPNKKDIKAMASELTHALKAQTLTIEFLLERILKASTKFLQEKK